MVMTSNHYTRNGQVSSIKSTLQFGDNFYAKYLPKEDAIVVGNDSLAFALSSEMLDREDYLELVKVSFGRLLEALDQLLLATPPAGHA